LSVSLRHITRHQSRLDRAASLLALELDQQPIGGRIAALQDLVVNSVLHVRGNLGRVHRRHPVIIALAEA
jgi:hypothetical protein